MKNNIAYTLLATLLIGLFGWLVLSVQLLNTTPTAFANGDGSTAQCTETGTSTGIDGSIGGSDNGGSQDLATYTAPSGKIVTGVCIKSGGNMFGGNKHSDVLINGTYESNCYTVSGIGTNQVTVTRNFDTNACQEISHIDAIYGDAPTSTPTPTATLTPTATPTATLTPTPTLIDCEDDEVLGDNGICIHIDCPGDGDCEVVINPTATPTPTVAPTATPTPGGNNPTATPTPGNVGGSSTTQSVLGTSTEPTKSVLGTTTLASTGVFEKLVTNIILLAGVAFIALSAASAYAKKNN